MERLIILLLLLSGVPVFAQTDRIDSLLNDLVYNDSDPLIMPEKPVKFDFIYTGLAFNSNTFYAGREVGTGMYNVSGHLYYYSSTGLFAGASGIWFDQLTPGYSSTTLSAGFSKAIDRKKLVVFRTSYSRFLYYKPDTGTVYPYDNNFSLGLSFRKNWIGARVFANLLFGAESKLTLSSAIYSRFTLIKLGKYNKIYTAPEISAFLGPETVATQKVSSQETQTLTDLKDVYGLLNTMLYIPVGISLGNFDVEVSYAVNFPSTQDVNISYPVKPFFSVSIGYMLPIPKK
jgi:hypothetical protein